MLGKHNPSPYSPCSPNVQKLSVKISIQETWLQKCQDLTRNEDGPLVQSPDISVCRTLRDSAAYMAMKLSRHRYG